MKNTNDNCIILYNDLQNFSVGSISVDDMNKKLKSVSKDKSIDYLLTPVSKSSHVYIATPGQFIPESFDPIDIEYTLVLKRYNHPAEMVLDKFRSGTSEVFGKTYKTRCNTFFDFQIFLFSMIKLSAYNVLNNTGVFHPQDVLLQHTSENYQYTFNIEKVAVFKNAKRILDYYNMSGIMDVTEQIQKAVSITAPCTDLRVFPSIFNFWIGYNGKCSYNLWNKPKKMVGLVNKVSQPCLISHACNNYNSYAFVSSKDEVCLSALGSGEMNIAIYSFMRDEDSLVTDGPMTIYDLLNNPELVAVHKAETYPLYTVGDYVEALVFAADMLDIVKLFTDIIGDEYKGSQIILEIRSRIKGGNKTFAYTVTKEQLDLGEITSVFDDFIELLDQFLARYLPF